MAEIQFSQKTESKTDRYRKDFIRLVIAQESEFQSHLEEFYDDVRESVIQGSTIKDESKINDELPAIVTAFTGAWLATMARFNSDAASIVSSREVDQIQQKYKNTQFTSMIRYSTEKFKNDTDKNFTKRTYPTDGAPIGERITTISKGSLKTVRNIIRVGIENGKSAKQVSEAIQNYVLKDDDKKWVSPYQYYRERFGYKTKRVPKGIPAGSLQHNTIRIARTEINNTWRYGVIKSHENMPWVKGYNWVLSPSHPDTDICDSWAEGGPYLARDVLGFGHPFCMCSIEVAYEN
jgi:hypothetical protein